MMAIFQATPGRYSPVRSAGTSSLAGPLVPVPLFIHELSFLKITGVVAIRLTLTQGQEVLRALDGLA